MLDINQFAKASKSKSKLGKYKYKLSNEIHFMINELHNISGSTGFCGRVFSGGYELRNDLGSGSGKSLRTFQSFWSLKIHRLSDNKHCIHWQNHKIR